MPRRSAAGDERSGTHTLDRRSVLKAGVATATAATGLASLGSATAATGCELPGRNEDFERRDPGAVGVDGQTLREAIDFLTRRNSRSVRVYRHNCCIGTSRLDPATGDVPMEAFSASKSIAAMVTARAVARGYLDYADAVGDHIPELPGVDDAHRAITVHQLLTQTSGLHNSGTEAIGTWNLGTPNEARYSLEVSFDHQPGTYFDYAQYPLTLLTYTVEQAIGNRGPDISFQEFAQDELFRPIGIKKESWYWTRDRAGHTHGYAGMHMAPKELARLGHLMLNRGSWNGTPLLRDRFIERAQTGTEQNPGYAYLFWVNDGDYLLTPKFAADRTRIPGPRPLVKTAPPDLYIFWGAFGQLVFIIPSLDVVVVRTGFMGNHAIDNRNGSAMPWGDQFYIFFRMLLEAIDDASPPTDEPYEYDREGTPMDFSYYFDSEAIATQYGLDTRPTQGCTPAGCDGDLAYEGVVRNTEDRLNTYLFEATGGE